MPSYPAAAQYKPSQITSIPSWVTDPGEVDALELMNQFQTLQSNKLTLEEAQAQANAREALAQVGMEIAQAQEMGTPMSADQAFAMAAQHSAPYGASTFNNMLSQMGAQNDRTHDTTRQDIKSILSLGDQYDTTNLDTSNPLEALRSLVNQQPREGRGEKAFTPKVVDAGHEIREVFSEEEARQASRSKLELDKLLKQITDEERDLEKDKKYHKENYSAGSHEKVKEIERELYDLRQQKREVRAPKGNTLPDMVTIRNKATGETRQVRRDQLR